MAGGSGFQQVFAPFYCSFLLFVAFWFEVLAHAVSHTNWYDHSGFGVALEQNGLKH